VACEDLVFGFSIPRSADPIAVFERMIVAINYSQQRLGGVIAGHDGQAFDDNGTREMIAHVVRRLTESGFPPGASRTLRQF